MAVARRAPEQNKSRQYKTANWDLGENVNKDKSLKGKLQHIKDRRYVDSFQMKCQLVFTQTTRKSLLLKPNCPKPPKLNQDHILQLQATKIMILSACLADNSVSKKYSSSLRPLEKPSGRCGWGRLFWSTCLI